MCDFYVNEIYKLNFGKGKRAKVNTFGCQMNAHDSEKLIDMISKMGYEIVDDDDADLILFNTCCIRENPEDRLFGNLGYLKNKKRLNPNLKVILCGCMMQQSHIIEKLQKSYGFVDVIFGTFNLYQFPKLLFENIKSGSQIIDIWDKAQSMDEHFSLSRKYNFKASVNIIYGCNNFCTYCIVPYVRGRERSRQSTDIVNEIKQLVDDGVVEVMLLGQNVNSYGLDLHDEKTNFAQLLYQINEIKGLERIRFMTSHPKDLSEDLIYAMRDCKKVCRHLHLPLQSGSNRILQLMNRRYTSEKYLELTNMLKKNIPNISLTTDIIVGFPEETDEDFEKTLDLVRQVKFDNAFTFIYSKRVGTKAASMSQQVAPEISKERFQTLNKVLNEIATDNNKKHLGQTEKILVEKVCSNKASGRNDNNILVHFDCANENLVGEFANVKIVDTKPFYLIGQKFD